MKRNDNTLPDRVLESLRDVPQPSAEKQARAKTAFLAQARELGRESPVSIGAVIRHTIWKTRNTLFQRRFSMTTVISALVLATLITTGGVVYASDDAVPGDALYGVDRAVEALRLRFAPDAERLVALRLRLATERLREAEELSAEGETDHLEEALDDYGETISGVAQTVGTTEGLNQEGLDDLLAATLADHEEQLSHVFESSVPDDDPDPEDDGGDDPHPVGQRLAERYDASYDDVMAWFEAGYGFGEIMLAFETSQETDLSAEELLALKTELGGWGLVWQEMGMIGKPEDVPGGPPDVFESPIPPAGPPEDVPVGPPEDVPGGPPDDRPVGPPEDRPGGPPDDRPVGPPEDKPGGPPEDVPVGPPEDVPGGPPDDRPVGPPEDKPVGPPEGR